MKGEQLQRSSGGEWRFMVAIALASLLPPTARGATTTAYQDILITPDMPTGAGGMQHGYSEYWITVTSRSDSRTHQVTLIYPKRMFHNRLDSIRQMSRTVEVGPGATVRVSLLQPDHPPVNGDGLGVTIDGVPEEDFIPFVMPPSQGFGRHGASSMSPSTGTVAAGELQVLVSAGVKSEIVDQYNARAPSRTTRGSGPSASHPLGGEAQLVRMLQPMSEWSPNWLGYSRFDGLIVTGEELRTAPAGVLTAVLQYTECGGCLLVIGSWDPPPGWIVRDRSGMVTGAESIELPAVPQSEAETYFPGFGICTITRSSPVGQTWSQSFWSVVVKQWLDTTQATTKTASAIEANTTFPVVDHFGVPVGGMFIVMVLFCIVIGPVNLVVLSHYKRRLWMLWTVPAISLVTCFAVFGYMLAVEGWQADQRTEGVTVLDEAAHRATTLGWTAFYATLTPSEGLHYTRDTELTAQLRQDWRGGGASRVLDWTTDQHLTSGWMSARIPTHFALRKSETRRERVTVTRQADGTYSAVNGLGVDITSLLYANSQGNIFTAESVPAGGQAKLQPSDLHCAGNPAALRSVFTTSWADTATRVRTTPAQFLVADSYCAILGPTPFVEQGLRHVKQRTGRSVVIGYGKRGASAD